MAADYSLQQKIRMAVKKLFYSQKIDFQTFLTGGREKETRRGFKKKGAGENRP